VQEQLGPKLQPAKAAVETIVIEHAEMPTENCLRIEFGVL
jgi:uncharacterized protein (TIGR03435 family)